MKNKNLKKEIKALYSRNEVLANSKLIDNFSFQTPFMDKYDRYDIAKPYKFIDKHPLLKDVPTLCHVNYFLYHGIRYQDYLEVLENIFKSKAILAGKYVDNCYSYEDNCNEGEYISLLEINEYEYNDMYEVFIKPNITLVISPFCEAYNTIYVPYNEWEEIKQSDRKFKNRFSYAKNEYQVKDKISLEEVVSVGVPYNYLISQNKISFANQLLEDTIKLMNEYNLDLPIVDTSNKNRILYVPELVESRKLVP